MNKDRKLKAYVELDYESLDDNKKEMLDEAFDLIEKIEPDFKVVKKFIIEVFTDDRLRLYPLPLLGRVIFMDFRFNDRELIYKADGWCVMKRASLDDENLVEVIQKYLGYKK